MSALPCTGSRMDAAFTQPQNHTSQPITSTHAALTDIFFITLGCEMGRWEAEPQAGSSSPLLGHRGCPCGTRAQICWASSSTCPVPAAKVTSLLKKCSIVAEHIFLAEHKTHSFVSIHPNVSSLANARTYFVYKGLEALLYLHCSLDFWWFILSFVFLITLLSSKGGG